MNKVHKELIDISIKEINDNIADCRKAIDDVNKKLNKLADTIDSCVVLTVKIAEKCYAEAEKKAEVENDTEH